MITFSEWHRLPDAPGQWYGDNLCVIDFEGSYKGSVVEAGVVRMNRNGEVSTWTGLFSPLVPPEWEEIRTHGLQETDWKGKPLFREYFEPFQQLRANGILAAHHAIVENRFLCDAWPMPGWVADPEKPGQEIASWGPWLDSRLLAERVFPGMSDYRLESLIRNLGLQTTLDQWAALTCPAGRRKYHSALYDALASWLLLLLLASHANWKEWTPAKLLRYQDAPPGTGVANQLDLF